MYGYTMTVFITVARLLRQSGLTIGVLLRGPSVREGLVNSNALLGRLSD